MDRLKYAPDLKSNARALRSAMTESENLLWSRLRRRQVLGVQFYRQRPVGNYIVDFFAPRARLVIEVDGSQHRDDQDQIQNDENRDAFLCSQGFNVLRFDNLEVLQETESVLEKIFQTVEKRLG